MASHWSHPLFVFTDNGQEYVSMAVPPGAAFPASAIQCYNASGPYQPLSWAKPTPVESAAKWMEQRRKEGFTFEPTTLEAVLKP
jgi:hypothetical protein